MEPPTTVGRLRGRVPWVDVLRAWCLVLMVAMHDPALAQAYGGRIHTLVYLFHVPAQVFLSGFCFRRRASSVGGEVLACCHKLLLPYFSHVVVFTAARVVARHWDGLDARTPRFVARSLFFGGRLLSGNMLALWVLPVLALTQMLWVVATAVIGVGVRAWARVVSVGGRAGDSTSGHSGSPAAHELRVTSIACGLAVLSYCCAVVVASPVRGAAGAAAPGLPPPRWLACDAVLSTVLWFAAGQLCRAFRSTAPAPAGSDGQPPALPGATVAGVVTAGVVLATVSGRVDALLPAIALDLRQSRLGMPVVTPALTACLVWAHVACARAAVAWQRPRTIAAAHAKGPGPVSAGMATGDTELASPGAPRVNVPATYGGAIMRQAAQRVVSAATAVSRRALAVSCWHIAVMRSPLFDAVGAPAVARVAAGVCVPLAVHTAFNAWWLARVVMLGSGRRS